MFYFIFLYVLKHGFSYMQYNFRTSQVAQGQIICLPFQETCETGGFDPHIRKIPWRKKWQPTPVSLPGESRGQRSLALQSLGLQRVGL